MMSPIISSRVIPTPKTPLFTVSVYMNFYDINMQLCLNYASVHSNLSCIMLNHILLMVTHTIKKILLFIPIVHL